MWYVLYTRPKAEKKVADILKKINVNVYCPLVSETRQWSDRKKRVTVPLFRSYVFVKLKEKERSKVFEVPGVVRYMYWLGRPAIVRDSEVETIQDWLEENSLEDLKVEQIAPGDKVIIKAGAFQNKEAIVKEVGIRRTRLILPGLGCVVSAKTRDVLQKVC